MIYLFSEITRPLRALTVAFHFIVIIFSFVQLASAVVLFHFGPEAVRSRGTVWFWCVVRRGHAGAVRCAGCQRFTVAQNVFDEERGGSGPRGAAGPGERLLLRGQRQAMRLAAVEVVVVVLKAVLDQVRLGAVLHGDRDGGRGGCPHSVYLRAWGRGRLAPEIRCPAVSKPEISVHEVTRVRGAR